MPQQWEPDGVDSPGHVHWIRAWFARLTLVYVLLHIQPFPFSLLGYVAQIPLVNQIPGVATALSWIVGLHGRIITPVVTWFGERVFDVRVTGQITGSGDRTFNYVELALHVSLALALATIWMVVARSRSLPTKAFGLTHLLVRYHLGIMMITYGWVKIFPLQMPLPGPDRLLQPYGDSSPMGLVWTFLGASPAYQIFGGLCEALGGYLFFWRRTTLLGALITAGVMTNVVAINFFYDVPVKLFSSHLVLLSIFVAAPNIRRLVRFFWSRRPVAPTDVGALWNATGRRRQALTLAHLAMIATITVLHVTGSRNSAMEYGFLRETSPIAGVYQVESFERGGLIDRDNEDDVRWVRVGLNPPFTGSVQRATGQAIRMRMDYSEEDGTLSLFDRGAAKPPVPQFNYELLEDGRLELLGTFEGEFTKVLLRRSQQGSLLLERGFHWINEYPFNR